MKLLKNIFITCFVIGLVTTASAKKDRDDANFELSKNLNIYHSMLRELNLLYVDDIDADKLIKTGIDEMLNTLDPYTVFIPESKVDDYKTMTTGEYAGIGAVISKHKDYVVIIEPYEGFPADKAGLKAGDKVLEIDGKDAKDMSSSDMTDIMKGEAGTSFPLKIERPGISEPMEMTITREKIQIKSVPYFGMVGDKIGYIMFTNFTNKAENEVKNALETLKAQGAESLIIDVRSNPGGLLDQAVKVINLFVDKEELVVSTKGKIEQWNKEYKTSKNPVDTEIPLVVLTSSSSASASEILAGAVQDLDRGIVIGARTFGKGLVQTTRNLSYNTKLKVTTSKYYIPSGRCIQALDYTNRNEDGSVGHIPDSLISEYKTRNNRTVYDGGGIMPDVSSEREDYSKLTSQLIIDYKVFDFAVLYANTHEPVEDYINFMISDSEYEEFRNFVKETQFEYKSETADALKALKEAIEEEKYDEVAKAELAALETKIVPDLDKDLDLFAEKLKQRISYEIVKNYHYKSGGIAYHLQFDETIEKAVEVLSDMTTYEGMLNGTVEVASSEK